MTGTFKSLLILVFSACTTIGTQTKGVQNFDKQGHRGCRGLMPENTIPAMIKAIDLGVTTLEMDVCFTADSQAVLSHEPFFSHHITTRPDGSFIEEKEEKRLNLFKMNYSEVIKYDVGMKPHPAFPRQQKIRAVKPLLSDVIDTVEKYIREKKLQPVHYNIETKTTPATDNLFHPAPGAFVDMLMKVILSKNIQERVTIQSFDTRTLQQVHLNHPGTRLSLLVEPSVTMSVQKIVSQLGFIPKIISPEYHLVNPGLVEYAHEQNMLLIPWTVNDSTTIQNLKKMNVDGIITDYPDLFR